MKLSSISTLSTAMAMFLLTSLLVVGTSESRRVLRRDYSDTHYGLDANKKAGGAVRMSHKRVLQSKAGKKQSKEVAGGASVQVATIDEDANVACFTDIDGAFPVCPGLSGESFCDGLGDCGTPWCECAVGQQFCTSGVNPCAGGDEGRDGQDEEMVNYAYTLCAMFETFDLNGRYENNDKTIPGFEWKELCDDFEPLDQFLCPKEETVNMICQHPRPFLNPAPRGIYCEPLTSYIQDDWYREWCETWCTNYVSEDRGGCCDLSCEGNLD